MCWCGDHDLSRTWRVDERVLMCDIYRFLGQAYLPAATRRNT